MLKCNAPECIARHFDGAAPPNGIKGTVFEVDNGERRGGEFWACSRRHVMAAIEAVLNG